MLMFLNELAIVYRWVQQVKHEDSDKIVLMG